MNGDPLLTYARFVAITGDATSATATVAARIVDAQELLEEELGRELSSFERTERVVLGANGRVWPSVTPITEADDYTLYGVAELGGAAPLSGPFDITDPSFAEITYTGGYTTTTVPQHIERDLAWATYALLHTVAPSPMLVGAKSASVGDASVTWDRPRSAAEAGISWSRATMRHKRRRL